MHSAPHPAPTTPIKNDKVRCNNDSPTCSTVIRRSAENRELHSLQGNNFAGLSTFANSPSPFSSKQSYSSWNTLHRDHYSTDWESQEDTDSFPNLGSLAISSPARSVDASVKQNDHADSMTASKVRSRK